MIDITERRATIAWEIDHCLKIGVIDKVVVLAEVPAAVEARAWIAATLGAGAPPLVRYTGARLVDAAVFQTLVLHHNLRTELPPDRRARALAIAFVAGGYAVMAAALLGIVRWLGPFLAR
jgi:hypothetical protein